MQRAKRTRVVIVDDHPIFRQGLRQVIQGNPCFDVVGEAGGADEALEMILEHDPDVAVLDLNLAGPSGFEVIKGLKARKCHVPIVVLTMVKEEQAFNRSLNLGVRGYVLKENASAEILNCIGAVAKVTHTSAPEPIYQRGLAGRFREPRHPCESGWKGAGL
jgi:DNA-binding NarL/FixJ family response regulator